MELRQPDISDAALFVSDGRFSHRDDYFLRQRVQVQTLLPWTRNILYKLEGQPTPDKHVHTLAS